MQNLAVLWNNPITRWIVGALGALAIVALTYMAGSSSGKRKARAESKVRALEKRIKIEEAQDAHVENAERVRGADNSDAVSVPDYHTRPE